MKKLELMVAVVAGLLLAGCASHGTPYPSGGSTDAATTTPPASTELMVPAGARLVAGSTTPPIPSFSIPEAGTLYIYDATASKVLRVTSVTTPQNPISLGSMRDVGAILDPTHQYNVYFVPINHATTLPSAIGS
jgi:PBP1b-binding outer membrane lipoprotein LpoB